MTRVKERQINRIKDIYLFLVENGPAKIEKIADYFGYSIRTIQRDMMILEYNHAVRNISRGIWKAVSPKKVAH